MTSQTRPPRPGPARVPRPARSRRGGRDAVRLGLRLCLLASPFAIWLAMTLAMLSTNPFARPFVEVSTAEAKRALDRALAIRVTQSWVEAEVETALAAEDLDRIDTVMAIAGDRGLVPAPAQWARIEALREAQSGFWAQAGTCGLCMADIAACPSIPMMAACGVPFELTPFGDVNALRRAGMAAWQGEDVDEVDVTLAIVGLGASGAVLVSGGSAATVKAGATVLRVGKRLGRLSPGLIGVLDVGLKPNRIWPWTKGRAAIGEVVDLGKLARLRNVTGDLARVYDNTSLTDAVLLLGHVENADDAARLARVSDAAGTRTRATMDTLGKRRAFRAVTRLGNHALAIAALVYMTAIQAALYLAGWAGTRTFRVAARHATQRLA